MAEVVTDVETEDEVKLAFPKKYKVVLLNDDFTPMDFVVHILRVIFHKETEEAIEVMLTVHQEGRGVAGIYPHEIAEQKRHEVVTIARNFGHPLMADLEQDG